MKGQSIDLSGCPACGGRPSDRGRPDRSGLDPDLSGGGRAAGGAPAEGPASAAVQVRRLTSSALAPCAVSGTEEGALKYRVDP